MLRQDMHWWKHRRSPVPHTFLAEGSASYIQVRYALFHGLHITTRYILSSAVQASSEGLD
jgi:hypothetical protein